MIRQLIEEVVKSLVDGKSAVQVDFVETSDGSLMYAIKLAKGDLGKVIGRKGQTIKAIRAMAQAVNTSDDKNVKVDIVS